MLTYQKDKVENWKLFFNCFLYFHPINFILNMQGATVPLCRATDEKQAQKALGKAKKKEKKKAVVPHSRMPAWSVLATVTVGCVSTILISSSRSVAGL